MFKKPTHYEVLNVSPEASALGIVKAYRETKLVFQPTALATYSLYTDTDLSAVNEQIEEAYAILSNSEARRLYDEELASNGIKKNIPKQQIPTVKDEKQDRMPVTKSIALPKHVHGKALEKLRKSQGITLDNIADKTNIPKAYLKAIESEDITMFPGTFYLKNYLKQYASSIGLNPQQTWKAYKALVKD
jgi:curved DNA-binding protein CbpA